MPRWALLLGAVALTVAASAGCGEQDASPGPTPSPEPAATQTPQPSPSPRPLREAPTTPTPSPTPSDRGTTPTPKRTSTPAPTARPAVTPTPTPTPTPEAAEPASFRYDTYDTTGAVTAVGSYAFLSDPDDTSTVVTTYEALRDGTTTALLIHTSDTHGASQAALYDAVEAADLFEWREAEDCWVRYIVEDVMPDPAGTVPRKLLAVEWITYTYTGCSGTISTSGLHDIGWSPANIQSPDVTSPVRHGPFLLIPDGWTGEIQQEVRVTNEPSEARATSSPADAMDGPADVQEHPLWSEPELPAGWVLASVDIAFDDYLATTYTPADRAGYVEAHVWELAWAPFYVRYVDPTSSGGQIDETRMIDGHPATLSYDPTNRNGLSVTVTIFNASSGIVYQVQSIHWELDNDYQAVIDIARSFYD